MPTVTIATFNCENLFARYKFETGPGGDKRKKVLTPEQLKERWGFMPPESWKNSFQLLGSDDWRKVTARALKGEGSYPDIVCLQEIESLAVLRRFNEDFLKTDAYPFAVLIDGHDPRMIDVGVLSVYPIVRLRSHMDEPAANGPGYVFSRDCLEVTIDVKGVELHLFVNHLKSKLLQPGQSKSAVDARRQAQAERVAAIVRERFGATGWRQANLVICGDFNDTPDSAPLASLLEIGFENVVDRLPANERWTHYWDKKNLVGQLDYLLVAPDLASRSGGLPKIERRGLVTKQGMQVWFGTPNDTKGAVAALEAERFPGVTNKISASDHCPVRITLNL